MAAVFENYLRVHSRLTDEDIAYVRSFAATRKLRRNESLLVAGEVCRFKAFIVSGLLRSYGVAADGSESILQFSPERTWAIDAESYNQQQPARYYITAIEPSEVLLWQKPDFDRLLSSLPGLKTFSEELISRQIYSGRERLLAALSASPEEKYQEFARNFPDLLSRLPLHMIASYLGISLKTLTRLRRAQWAR